MKKYYFILSVSIILLGACSAKSKKDKDNLNVVPEKNTIIDKTDVAKALDLIIKLSDFSFRSDYCFITADGGTLYDPKRGNTLGNAVVYLLPISNIDIVSKTKNRYEITDSLEFDINHTNLDSLKMKYEIYISIDDKNYLIHDEKANQSYYTKEFYLVELYHYDRQNLQWTKLDSKMIEETNTITEWMEPFEKKYFKYKFNIVSYIDKWAGLYSYNYDCEDCTMGQNISFYISANKNRASLMTQVYTLFTIAPPEKDTINIKVYSDSLFFQGKLDPSIKGKIIKKEDNSYVLIGHYTDSIISDYEEKAVPRNGYLLRKE